MDFRRANMLWEEVRQKDLVSYLTSLGYHPARIRNHDYWYHSPLRSEKTPSFKVNQKLNRWYDHGIARGGNIIDFGVLYHGCSPLEFLQKLSTVISFHQPLLHPSNLAKTEPRITIQGDFSLSSRPLRKYLEQRRIPQDIADQYCREIRYQLSGKLFYAIGFKNDSGGFELRNPYFKAGNSPKDVTTFDNGSAHVSVFEGFMDFLSFLTIHQNRPQPSTNYLVLNSVSFFEKARTYMERHERINLYLDRDTTGQNYREYATSLSQKYIDQSHLYKKHKDLNDWLVNAAGKRKKYVRQKPG